MLVVTPLFLPAAAALGKDRMHLGIVLVFNIMIGLIARPYGIFLFIIKAWTGFPVAEMIREIWILLALLITLLMVLTFSPDLVLWLPRFAGMMRRILNTDIRCTRDRTGLPMRHFGLQPECRALKYPPEIVIGINAACRIQGAPGIGRGQPQQLPRNGAKATERVYGNFTMARDCF